MKYSVSVIGVFILCLGCAATFAPRITDTLVHRYVIVKTECLSCHLEGKNGAPVVPARMLQDDRRNCIRCHK